MTQEDVQGRIAKKWMNIVEVHNQTKSLIIFAEETDSQHEFFWPPLIQQRDALDHIIRAQRASLDPTGGKDSEYVLMQLDKALGHAYRAFFDVADWFAVVTREQASEILSQYSRRTLLSVVPDLATRIEEKFDDACSKIADLRTNKDIGGNGAMVSIGEYIKITDTLGELLKEIKGLKPQCDAVEQGSVA